MQESKSVATNRLRREGRWEQASAYKDTIIAECRSEGMKRPEAQAAGWAAMTAKFSPLEVESDHDVELADPDADKLPDSTPDTLLGDAYFVLNSLGRAKVRAADAPTAGAWAMLRWARKNEHKFYDSILPRALTLSNKLEIAETEEDANREHVQSLREMLGV